MTIKTIGQNPAYFDERLPEKTIHEQRLEWVMEYSKELEGIDKEVELRVRVRLQEEYEKMGIYRQITIPMVETDHNTLEEIADKPCDGKREYGFAVVAKENKALEAFVLKHGLDEEAAKQVVTYVKHNTIAHELYHGAGTYDVTYKDEEDAKYMRDGAQIERKGGNSWEEGLACYWAKKVEDTYLDYSGNGKETLTELLENKGYSDCVIRNGKTVFIEVRYPNSLRLVLFLHNEFEKHNIDFPKLEERMRIYGEIKPVHDALSKMFGRNTLKVLFETKERNALETMSVLKQKISENA